MNEIEKLESKIRDLENQLRTMKQQIKVDSKNLPYTMLNNNSKLQIIKLLENDAKFKAVFMTLIEGVVFFNKDGQVEKISDSVENIYGHTLNEFNKPNSDPRYKLIRPDGSNLPIEEHPAMVVLKTCKPVHNVELGVPTKDGAYTWRLVNANPVFDYDNNLIGAVATFYDISDIKKSKSDLKKSQLDNTISERTLKRAQEIAHIGNWIWNIKTNSVNWSDEMFKIFGVDKDLFNGNLSEVMANSIHPDDLEKVVESNKSVIEDKKPYPLEYRVCRSDGSIRVIWAEAGDLLLDKKGNPEILSGIVVDITDRKKIEEEKLKLEHSIQRTQRLESIALLA